MHFQQPNDIILRDERVKDIVLNVLNIFFTNKFKRSKKFKMHM